MPQYSHFTVFCPLKTSRVYGAWQRGQLTICLDAGAVMVVPLILDISLSASPVIR